MNDMVFTPLKNLYRDNHIIMGREDLLPDCFGGNKVRIAGEYVSEALKEGCDSLIVYGDASSNLCRVMALMCLQNGLEGYAVFQLGTAESYEDTFNSMMVRQSGMKIVPCHYDNVAYVVKNLMDNLRAQGKKPYYIHGNEKGTGHETVPVRAYRKAYGNILDYEKMQGRPFDYIFHASGTGTTQSGLLMGQQDVQAEYAALGWRMPEIYGISIGRNEEKGVQVIEKYIGLTMGDELPLMKERINLDDRFRKGQEDPELDKLIRRNVRQLFIKEGIPSDTLYVGRAFTGMNQILEDKGIQGKRILFLHTGGTPLFYTDWNEVMERKK